MIFLAIQRLSPTGSITQVSASTKTLYPWDVQATIPECECPGTPGVAGCPNPVVLSSLNGTNGLGLDGIDAKNTRNVISAVNKCPRITWVCRPRKTQMIVPTIQRTISN